MCFRTVVLAVYHKEHINVRPYCRIMEYIWIAMKFYSQWIMVLISLNIYALVCRPFTHKKVTSIKFCVVLGVWLGSSLHYIWNVNRQKRLLHKLKRQYLDICYFKNCYFFCFINYFAFCCYNCSYIFLFLWHLKITLGHLLGNQLNLTVTSS